MSAPQRGVLAVYKSEQALFEACREMKRRNFKKFDAYTPFPMHGIDDAMGIKRSAIPYVSFIAGVLGCSGGLLLQIWTSAVDWPLNVGGKPFVSLPAFIPVTFETTVLFAGLATAAALFYFCGLPDLSKPVFHKDFTNDTFGLFVPASEKGFNADDVTAALKKAGAIEVRMVGA